MKIQKLNEESNTIYFIAMPARYIDFKIPSDFMIMTNIEFYANKNIDEYCFYRLDIGSLFGYRVIDENELIAKLTEVKDELPDFILRTHADSCKFLLSGLPNDDYKIPWSDITGLQFKNPYNARKVIDLIISIAKLSNASIKGWAENYTRLTVIEADGTEYNTHTYDKPHSKFDINKFRKKQ